MRSSISPTPNSIDCRPIETFHRVVWNGRECFEVRGLHDMWHIAPKSSLSSMKGILLMHARGKQWMVVELRKPDSVAVCWVWQVFAGVLIVLVWLGAGIVLQLLGSLLVFPLPLAASWAAQASSNDFPAICLPGAMHYSVQWLGCLQFVQGGLGIFAGMAARAVASVGLLSRSTAFSSEVVSDLHWGSGGRYKEVIEGGL